MAIFGKDSGYMDYTLLKKKGMLKLKEQKIESMKTEGGFVDFTSLSKQEAPATPAPEGPNLDFLSNLASANPSTPSASNTGEPSEMSTLKIKMDDMEYKLERFMERIDRLEEQLSRHGQGNF